MKQRWLALLLAVVFILSAGMTASADELSEAKKKLQDLKAQQTELKDRLTVLQGQKTDLTSYLETLDQELAAVNDRCAALLEDQAEQKEALEQVKQEAEEAQKQVDEQYAAMKLRIRYLYEAGETGLLELLFTAADLTELLSRAEYISALTAYDRTKLEEYKAALEVAKELQKKQEEAQEALLQTEAALTIEKENLELLIGAKQAELADCEAQIGQIEGQLETLKGSIAAAQSTVDRIQNEIWQQQQQGQYPGSGSDQVAHGGALEGWIWPAPTCRIITSDYNVDRGTYRHKGLDMAKYGDATGEPIVAVAPGKVVLSAYSDSAGNWIIIDHGTDAVGNRVYTVYMHCNERLVSAGANVKAGQLIGLIGNTGNSRGAHLHFEIRLNNYASGQQTLNPRNYVSP